MDIQITDYDATPGADSINTQAIQAAIDAAAVNGRRVVVPEGSWKTGTLWLKSHVELHLEEGAILLGTNNPDDYPKRDAVEAGLVVSRRAFDRRMIGGWDVEDVAITGKGTIDGDGGCLGMKSDRGNEGRPANLQFVKCRNVRIEDVTLRRAGSWMQQHLACDGLRIERINVWNHDNHTNDGLDLDGSANVTVTDCVIDSRDDALVFKSTGPSPCRNITVTGCTLRSACHCIKFGTESVGGFENITISNCTVAPTEHPYPAAGYPGSRPVVTGCALECTDGGTMKGITITGLKAEKVFSPIFIKLGDRHDRRVPGEDFTGQGTMEDIHLSDITIREAGPISGSITGCPGNPIRNVRLENIDIEQIGGVAADRILHDVPEANSKYPECNMFTKSKDGPKDMQLPSWLLFLRHIDGITLSNVKARLTSPDARKPIVVDDVAGLELQDVECDGETISSL